MLWPVLASGDFSNYPHRNYATMTTTPTRRTPLGRLLFTAGVAALADSQNGHIITELVTRHHCCDWGDVSQEDWKQNDKEISAKYGRVLSCYETDLGRIWINTHFDTTTKCRDCNYTTVMLPEEY